MTGTRLVLVILAVADLPRALAFYRAAVPARQTVDVPVYAELELEGGMRLGLYERRAFAANVGRVPVATPAGELAPCELYLYVDDLDRAEERLRAAGGRLLSARSARPWGDVAAYYADPDGNVVVAARPDLLQG